MTEIELSVTSAAAKRRAIRLLRERGYRAMPGAVRLAYPFTVLVEHLGDAGLDEVPSLVTEVDPGAGVIWSSRQVTRVPG